MIYAFTGKTGSGKTFNMVRVAYKEWLNGVDIYSNTILKFGDIKATQKRLNMADDYEYFSFFEKLWFRIKNIRGNAEIPERGRIYYFEDISEILEAKNGVILFDEAQVLFNARNWESLPNEFQYKLQQHRKHRLDLLCTTQNIRTIDVNFRRLVQYWFHFEPIIQLGQNPVFLGLFRKRVKDVDMLWESVDELKVDDIKIKYFTISRWSKVLYDTMYDIGFKRFKTVWLHSIDLSTSLRREWLIMPKEMSLQEGQRVIRLLSSGLQPFKSKSFKKN